MGQSGQSRSSQGDRKASGGIAVSVSALRRGREALIELDGQLDEALVWVREPGRGIDASMPDRLARTARRAGDALTAAFVPSHAIF